MERCKWCECNELIRMYHDEEWGMPIHDDRMQFEYLMMEVMQCGLNWNMMLKSVKSLENVLIILITIKLPNIKKKRLKK